MFVHQRYDYEAMFLVDEQLDYLYETLLKENPTFVGFDTETTGLNFMIDKPFLIVIGFNKHVFAFEPTIKAQLLVRDVVRFVGVGNGKYLIAHNTQYDYHMLNNLQPYLLDDCSLADSMIVARLTQYADEMTRISLESVGTHYVAPDAKIAGKSIRNKISEINRERKKHVKTKYLEEYKRSDFEKVFDEYKSRVQFLSSPYEKEFKFIEEHYNEANYEDVYKQHPNLMINYAMDDVVIMLEFLNKAWKTLLIVDPDLVTFKRECELIRIIAEMERVGLKADVDYLLESRAKILAYKDKLYTELHEACGQVFTVGQHKVIKDIFRTKLGIILFSTDEKSMQQAVSLARTESAQTIIKTILELRTLDKWLTTYIDGKLNAVTNGRIHTSINTQGTVSGRVTSNLQQQPNKPVLDREGNELFHPRKVFIADKGTHLVFIDFNQMELRYQAYYTMKVGVGDKNLCRAFIPFGCTSAITEEVFDSKDPKLLQRWNSGEWVDEKLEQWEPTDLHAVTTFLAFPHLNNDKNHPEFKAHRKLGKVCNFLKNYQGGERAIIEQLGVSEEIAKRLDQAYYKAFPEVKTYQRWVSNELLLNGFVSNLYGRRYYMQEPKWFYKASNYVIQGGCADLVKQKQIDIYAFIKTYELNLKMALSIHDEIVFIVPDEEMINVEFLKEITEDTYDKIEWIPMVSEVSVSTTNWADKKEINHAK